MTDVYLTVYIFACGLCIGSFLNVCIYRIPAGKSVVSPASSCPVCHTKIAPYDNIPLFSYILLKGKCRYCKTPYSPRYFFIELLTGLFALATLFHFGVSIKAFIAFIFIATLIVITFIDIDHQIIPNVISLPGIPIFFGLAFVFYHLTHSYYDILKQSGIGIIAGWGSLFIVASTYQRLTGKTGMGMGDLKLLAMIGALTGWKGILFTIFASSTIGTFVGVSLMLIKGSNLKLKIPFGPFLSAGAVIYLFYGERLIYWYMYTFGRKY